MTKIELQAQVLWNRINDPEAQEQSKVEAIAEAIKESASGAVNLIVSLKEKEIGVETLREIVEDYGLTFNAKTKKFQ